MKKNRGNPNEAASVSESHAIAVHRRKFLLASEVNTDANRMFMRLANDAQHLKGPALQRLIEDWAITSHLAAPPAREWWIVPHMAEWLRTLAIEPPLLNAHRVKGTADITDAVRDAEEVEDYKGELEFRADWLSYSSIRRFASIPNELPFRICAYDPASQRLDQYEKEVRDSFGEYLKHYLAGQVDARVPEKRDGLLHYEWLVRYQLLGHSMKDIADTVGEIRIWGSVNDAVHKLRNLIHLPRLKPRGRPAKIVGRVSRKHPTT